MSKYTPFRRLAVLAGLALGTTGCGEVIDSVADELRSAPTEKELASTTTFQRPRISFTYPNIFRPKQEFESDDGLHWTYTFRRAQAELLVLPYEADVDDWLLSSADFYDPDAERAVESAQALTICGQVVEGRRVRASVLGVAVTTVAYSVDPDPDRTILLAITDEPSDSGTPSPEAEAFLQQFTASARCGERDQS